MLTDKAVGHRYFYHGMFMTVIVVCTSVPNLSHQTPVFYYIHLTKAYKTQASTCAVAAVSVTAARSGDS